MKVVQPYRAIRTAPQVHQPGQRVRHLRGRGIGGGGQRAQTRQVLPLEAREPGIDRCELRVLLPELRDPALDADLSFWQNGAILPRSQS
jgi:hypothetical protein